MNDEFTSHDATDRDVTSHDDDVLEKAVRQLNETVLDESRMPVVLAATRQALARAVQADTKRIETRKHRIIVWRNIVKNHWIKLTTVAAVIAVAFTVWMLAFSSVGTATAYAWEQTVEAFKTVQWMHVLKFSANGQVADDRWIEIGPDGRQARYRQDTRGGLLVIDDRETVAVYHRDKDAVVLYGPDQRQWQLISSPGRILENIASGEGGYTIEEDVDYKGRKAHLIRWSLMNMNVYIDPETKLPINAMGYEVSYEDPPAGTFDILTDGLTVVDKRPGAEPAEEPEWLKQIDDAHDSFKPASYALAEGDYERAIELFGKVVKFQPGRNWGWHWLGKAYYQAGQYDNAVQNFSKEITIIGELAHYARFARGLAYKQLGMEDEAKQDFSKVLPVMIDSLRHSESALMFDYADDPLMRYGVNVVPTEQVSAARMTKRLQEVTGQNFGFDPAGTAEQREAAIAAWESWWAEHAADYGVGAKE